MDNRGFSGILKGKFHEELWTSADQIEAILKTNSDKPRLVYITAGAGGMYCGSCLHDNALAKALAKIGWDVQLVPFYTPIRTDEQDASVDQVF